MENTFGWQLLLDLYDCDDATIRSRSEIARFVIELCRHIDMKPFGEPLIEHFGYEKPETVGYSLVQLIETSAIVGHFSEHKRAAYLDIFSCKQYDPDKVTRFAQEFFCARSMNIRFIERV